ncbi:MAG TPA: S41 family peptidase [Blastocatellia bacterium]|nr:S41 family peptidase [Blastocatellia bacterium]
MNTTYKLISPTFVEIEPTGESTLKRALRIVLLSLLLCFGIAAQTPRPAQGVPGGVPVGVVVPGDVRQEAFDIVWRTVKDKHFDPTLGGLDWDKVREQYAPRAAAAKSDSEFYAVLRQMLGELHQSHFNIIPPEAVMSDDSSEPKDGAIGIDLRIVDGQAMITRVEPGSRAAAAGLRPGFIIKKVDDTTAEQIIALFAKSKESDAMRKLRITRNLMSRINGAPETTVRVAYLDERDQPREAAVARERLKGEMSQRLGNFPPQYTEFEAKRLAGGIGYIRFNIFVVLLTERIKGAIRGMADAPGIIIDLRGNPGGVGLMAPGIAGVLGEKVTSLGTMTMRSGHNRFSVNPQPPAYLGPVVILTDGGSGSTSEIFAGGLQELGRAIVVGERTVGAALPSFFQKLPTGALFQFAIADFRTPKGMLIEGRGVAPDVEVKMNRRALLDGHDPQLDAAIEEITKRAHGQQPRKAAFRLESALDAKTRAAIANPE